MSYRPACYDSDLVSDGEELYGIQNNPSKKKKFVKKTKTNEELFKEKLLLIVNEQDCAKLKKTLNENPKFNLDQPVFLEWPILFFACHMAYTDIVEYLIEERKRDVNFEIESETPLTVACNSNGVSKKVFNTVELLISKGSIVNISTSSGTTPLMFASMKDHLNVVEYLLQKKAVIGAIDNEGRNALHCAVEYNRYEIAKLLIEAGIDLSVRNKKGYSAKLLAQKNIRTEIETLFPQEDKNFLVPIDYRFYETFEDLVPAIQKESKMPHYFPDVVRMLEGMNCKRFINNFSKANVSLEEFLNISDERLKNIGIRFPYQRKMILNGLNEFHKKDWSKMSYPIFDDDVESCITTQYYHLLATLYRQLIVVKATCIHLKESRYISPSVFEEKFDQILLSEHYKHLSTIKKEFEKISKRSIKETVVHPTYIGINCDCPLWIDDSEKPINGLNQILCISLPLVLIFCGVQIYKTLKL
ncbi:unnamed protein product [Diamesa hyperborea]